MREKALAILGQRLLHYRSRAAMKNKAVTNICISTADTASYRSFLSLAFNVSSGQKNPAMAYWPNAGIFGYSAVAAT